MERDVAMVDGKAGAEGVTLPDLPGSTLADSSTDGLDKTQLDAITGMLKTRKYDQANSKARAAQLDILSYLIRS